MRIGDGGENVMFQSSFHVLPLRCSRATTAE